MGPTASGEDQAMSELREKHRVDLERLTLTSRPFKTLEFFVLAIAQSLGRTCSCVLKKGARLKIVVLLVVSTWVLLLFTDGPHERHVQELLWYVKFGLWWVVLGVTSSIGLGSGLHTFVLYLGPHIALFTIKAVQCGRVDLKSAPYDTILLKRRPSWLEKDCLEFGPPIHQATIPFSTILQEVYLEAVLWGLGTALGELPPYFLSRAASMSGRKIDELEELDASISEGFLSSTLHQAKSWLMSHSQHLNFTTILLLASVPNPLFDLAGILCGQFNIPFWKFFLATLIGKAIVKVCIQTTLVITLCNNQLLDLVEKRLIWAFGYVPGVASVLPFLVAKLKTAKNKFLSAHVAASASVAVKGKKWNLSFSLIWNTVVWLMVINFIIQIVTSTAQGYVRTQQELEICKKLSENKRSASEPSVGVSK
ncbi:vacuole membrane protein KMS1-like [Phragmites australis]|uniref:vacuole membrane protein KMS1-like n=1 Tax=Phragmites australis TaxID=29695 RepID=UPI002D79B3A8|nr:vacuole membrane protein KMS1-like [Phragmites australis]